MYHLCFNRGYNRHAWVQAPWNGKVFGAVTPDGLMWPGVIYLTEPFHCTRNDAHPLCLWKTNKKTNKQRKTVCLVSENPQEDKNI